MNDVKLLPLPPRLAEYGETTRSLWQDYARACIEADRKARVGGGEAVAEVPRGHPSSIVHWLKPMPPAGTKLYTHPAPDDVVRLVEA